VGTCTAGGTLYGDTLLLLLQQFESSTRWFGASSFNVATFIAQDKAPALWLLVCGGATSVTDPLLC
jgi:hypothetical protein